MSTLRFWRSRAITSLDDMHNTKRFTVLDLVSGTFSKYLYLGHVRATAIVKPVVIECKNRHYVQV